MTRKRKIQLILALMTLFVIGGTMLVNSPRVQRRVSVILATELENHIGTRVSLGGVRWLFPTDIIIDSLSIDDQEGEQLVTLPHVAAKMEWKPLLRSWIKKEKLQFSVRNVRIFHPDINIYRESPEAAFNYQFLIDAFAAPKEEKQPSRLDLRINTLLIRHANVKVENTKATKERDSKPSKSTPLSSLNLQLENLSTNISLKAFTADSLSLAVRELCFAEQSGLEVNNLRFRFVGNKQGGTLAGFSLSLPNSHLRLDTLWAAWDPLLIKGKTQLSHVTPNDLACLIPAIKGFNEKVYLHADFVGSPSRINIKEADLHTTRNDIAINLDGWANLSNKKQPEAHLELNKATITSKAWKLLEEQIPTLYTLIPQEVIRTGGITAKGELQLGGARDTATLQINTDVGILKTGVSINDKGHYIAHLNGTAINIGQIIPTSPLRQTNLALKVEGDGLKGEFEGIASNTRLLDYQYEAINLKGNYGDNVYKANININDPNGELELNAEYADSGRVPRYRLDLTADSIDLHALNLIDIHEDKSFSTHLEAELRGNDIDHIVGKVNINNLTMHREGDDYMVRDIFINSAYRDSKLLTLSSSFASATVRGDFSYGTLPGSLKKHLHEYLPSFFPEHGHNKSDNNCFVQIDIYNTQPIEELLLIPLSIRQQATIKANLTDNQGTTYFDLKIPHFNYNGNNFTNVGLDFHNDTDTARIYAHGIIHTAKDIHIPTEFEVKAKNDRIILGAEWESTSEGQFAGEFNTSAILSHNAENDLEIAVRSDRSHVIINREKWTLNPFDLYIAPQRTSVSNFHFEHDKEQFLDIEGSIAETLDDTLNIKINNIDLSYLLSLVKLEGISFGGSLSGTVDAASLYSPKPYINAHINAQDFSFCKGILGDADIQAQWNADSTRLEFVADINETLQDTTRIEGEYNIGNNELWIDIDAHNTNLSFLNDLTKSFIDNVEGHANGHLLLGGKLDSLDMEGALLADTKLRLVPTNTKYTISDTIRFDKGKIQFDNITLLDERKNQAVLNGVVNHERIAIFDYALDIKAKEILGIDLRNETGEESFYTTIYGTGDIHVNGGPGRPLEVNINAETEDESVFALNLAGQSTTTSENFITFHERSSKRNTPTQQTTRTRRRRNTQEASESLQLNIIANVSPKAKLKLVMDPITDDHISASGSGELRILTDDDKLEIFGTYYIDHGEYRLNIDLITKNFTVTEGSTVSFNGDPMNAELNITARYIAPLTQFSDLSPELSGSVQANCLIKINGTLNDPQISFDIELPRATEDQKSILRSYTSTEEQRNLQFIYLLAAGRFYTQDMSQTSQGARIESFLSNTISGQLSNFISNFIDNDHWNFSGNIHTENLMSSEPSTETWDNMEIEGMLEGRLLNNKLLINGNFGYRNNPIYATNLIGDFDLRYLLTNHLSLKGYSKTNDRYFTKTALYTQGFGLLYQHEFNNFWKPKGKKKN